MFEGYPFLCMYLLAPTEFIFHGVFGWENPETLLSMQKRTLGGLCSFVNKLLDLCAVTALGAGWARSVPYALTAVPSPTPSRH